MTKYLHVIGNSTNLYDQSGAIAHHETQPATTRLSPQYAASFLLDMIPCQTAGVALKKMLLETH